MHLERSFIAVIFSILLFEFSSAAQTNIVQNGEFITSAGKPNFADWTGVQALTGVRTNTMQGNMALGGNMSQTLSTIPGVEYSISFYAAADLYFGPSATIDLVLNNQTLAEYITPPYPYISQINRADQMQFQELTSSFVATSNQTILAFVDENTYDFGLAEVSVTPVPDQSSTAGLILLALLPIAGATLKVARITSARSASGIF